MNKKLIFGILIIVYLIIAFVTEFFYRNKLYEKSVDYINGIEQEGFFHYFYFFWSSIFLYLMIGVGIFITLFFYSINIFYCHLSNILILMFIMCILKSLYSNSRPFWDIYLEKQLNSTEKIQESPTECDGEFGNPSGHALLSIYSLTLWNLFINSNFFNNKISENKKNIIKYVTLIFAIISIIFVAYSRINRQIHSFNQIIFGGILGLAIYFFLCYIVEINKLDTTKFMLLLEKSKYIINPVFFILFIISIILGLTRHNKKEDEYFKILEIYCGYIRSQIFGRNTAFHSSMILPVIGGYLGLLLLKNKITKNFPKNEQIFYEWNKGRISQTIKIGLFSFILPSLYFIFVLITPFKYYALKFILSIIGYFLYGFLSVGPLFYFACSKFNKDSLVKEALLINNEERDNSINI